MMSTGGEGDTTRDTVRFGNGCIMVTGPEEVDNRREFTDAGGLHHEAVGCGSGHKSWTELDDDRV